mgnify:CR=1 FL=1
MPLSVQLPPGWARIGSEQLFMACLLLGCFTYIMKHICGIKIIQYHHMQQSYYYSLFTVFTTRQGAQLHYIKAKAAQY